MKGYRQKQGESQNPPLNVLFVVPVNALTELFKDFSFVNILT